MRFADIGSVLWRWQTVTLTWTSRSRQCWPDIVLISFSRKPIWVCTCTDIIGMAEFLLAAVDAELGAHAAELAAAEAAVRQEDRAAAKGEP